MAVSQVFTGCLSAGDDGLQETAFSRFYKRDNAGALTDSNDQNLLPRIACPVWVFVHIEKITALNMHHHRATGPGSQQRP